MGCSFTLCLGRKNGKQFYIMPRTKKGVQFYVVLRTKVGCSFMSCPGQRSDAVLCHAQDEGQMQFYVMPRTRINLKLRRSPVMNQEYYGSTSAHYT